MLDETTDLQIQANKQLRQNNRPNNHDGDNEEHENKRIRTSVDNLHEEDEEENIQHDDGFLEEFDDED